MFYKYNFRGTIVIFLDISAYSGTIPKELGALKKLRKLRLEDNLLTGEDVKRRHGLTIQ